MKRMKLDEGGAPGKVRRALTGWTGSCKRCKVRELAHRSPLATQEPVVKRRQRGFIARTIGIAAIALGFVAGMQGLDHPESPWLPTALGLIVTGVLAQVYAFYCSFTRGRDDEPTKNTLGPPD